DRRCRAARLRRQGRDPRDERERPEGPVHAPRPVPPGHRLHRHRERQRVRLPHHRAAPSGPLLRLLRVTGPSRPAGQPLGRRRGRRHALDALGARDVRRGRHGGPARAPEDGVTAADASSRQVATPPLSAWWTGLVTNAPEGASPADADGAPASGASADLTPAPGASPDGPPASPGPVGSGAPLPAHLHDAARLYGVRAEDLTALGSFESDVY